MATIQNDDALPVLTISPVSVNEGNIDTRSLVFVASLNLPSGLTVQVDYSSADGTAGFPADYIPVNGRLMFTAGEIQKTVSVVVNGDTEVEPDEIFYLNLGNPVNADLPQVQVSGTILDDDGVVGQIHHFEFAPIPSQQYAGEPFAVTVTALDYEGGVVTDYTGPLPLVARTPSTQVFNFLGNIPPTTSFSGNYTVGFGFTPTTDITVTHFRHYFGTKASIWTDNGNLLVSQPLFGATGTWNETLLSTPVVLRAGIRYRYGVYSGNGALHYVGLNLPQSQHAVLHGEYESGGDNFIGSGPHGGHYYLLDLGFEAGSIALTPASPAALTGFSGGVWSGNVTVLEPVQNTVLKVDDGDGHRGVAEAIQVGLHNDLAISLSTSNERPELGDQVTWTSTVRYLGPDVSAGVVVRQTLPYGILFVSGTTSLGSGCTADGSNVNCDIGAMSNGDEVTVEIVVEVHADGRMTSTSTASRTESEAYTRNNSASVPMNVLGGDDFRIISLDTTGALSIEHNFVTGDDRGGIAVSDTHVFYTGDSATGRFGLEDLSEAVSTGGRYDALCSDLRSSVVYHFANGGGFVGQGGSADSLIQLDGATGAPTGMTIPLSQSINLTQNSGIFSGYGHVLVWVHQGGILGRVYDIQVPSGLVTDLGQATIPARQFSESWAFWGVAENVSGVFNLVYVRDYQAIVRTRVSDGFTEEVARFANLSDMASFTVKPDRNRWYFKHEGQSQFRNGDETIGFADATFETRHRVVSDDVSVEVTATSETIDPGSDVPFSITVRNSGPSLATGVQLEVTVDGPATVTTASSSAGTVTINGNTVFVDIGDLAADAAVTVELVDRQWSDAHGVVTCQAAVTRSEVDYYYNNNFSSATSVVASPVLVSVSDVEVFEGSDSFGVSYSSVDVTVTLSRAAPSEVTVNYQTVDGTANSFSDYAEDFGQVVFTPGETVKTISTYINQDLDPENDEYYEIVLSNPSNAQLGQDTAMVTILDDDSGGGGGGGEGKIQLRQLAGVYATVRPALLSITCVEMPTETSSAALRLSFDSVVNVRYVVEATSSVGGEWEELLAIQGTGKRVEILEKAGKSETRIYRLRAQ